MQNKKLGSEILDLLNQPTAKVSNFDKATLIMYFPAVVSCKNNIWVKIFKNGPSKICGRQPLKNLK